MRNGLLMCAAAALSGCGGLLMLEEPRADGTRSAQCEDSTDCNAGLICGLCDDTSCCVTSPGPCSPAFPDGDCPLEWACDRGVCVKTGESWCNCAPEKGCADGVCVDVDASNQCSAINLGGVCREGHVCNGGSCVPCTADNSCGPGKPNGCCRSGADCQAPYCFGDVGEECSPANRDGDCPAGYACNDTGQCEQVHCSEEEPFGYCEDRSEYCDGGTCVCIPCSLDIVGCCEDSHFCSVAGFCIADGFCEVDLDCPTGMLCSVTRVCLTPPACNDPADCRTAGEVCASGQCTTGCTSSADCDTGYTCNGTVCVADTCESLGCAALNRNCDDTTHPYAICTDCVTGFHEDAGSDCVADTCADINCDAVNRLCDDSGPYAVCGACLPGYNDVNGVCSNCTVTADCDPGEFCSAAQSCEQECDPTTPPDPPMCPDGRRCSPHGRCVSTGPDAHACAAAVTEGDPIEPVVMILVDQSGSMTNHYDVGSRWDDLEDVLFDDPGGVVKPLENDIMFGLVLYTSGGGCPRLRQEDHIGRTIGPKLANHADMRDLYANQSPSGDTPTGDSIDGVVTYLNGLTLDPPRAKYILLATDGEPDRCEELNPQRGQAESVVAARNAFDQGVQTFMLSVGSDVRDDHMQDVANAGAGCPIDPFYDDAPTCTPITGICYDKQDHVTDYSDYDPRVVHCPDDAIGDPIRHPFYKATNRQDLIDGLNEILTGVLSCVVALNVTTGQRPLDGTVYVDGDPLPQGAPNGWVITGTDTVTFVGAACTAITDGQSHFIAIVIDTCEGEG